MYSDMMHEENTPQILDGVISHRNKYVRPAETLSVGRQQVQCRQQRQQRERSDERVLRGREVRSYTSVAPIAGSERSSEQALSPNGLFRKMHSRAAATASRR